LGIHQLNGYFLLKKLLGKTYDSCSNNGRLENEKAVQYLVSYLEVMHSPKRIR